MSEENGMSCCAGEAPLEQGLEQGEEFAGMRKKAKGRVRRIAGQVAGIERMIDEGRYCVDILNQIAAVRSALDGLGVELLHQHMEGCVLGHGSGSEHEKARPMSREALLKELKTALDRFLR